MVLEICVDSVESAIAADAGGAERIELCSALREGGITPSTGLISMARAMVSLDVFVLIRPRGGDFVYTAREFEVMEKDIRIAKSEGANGVVFGLLTSEGRIDMERTRMLIDLARPLQVTFHRAFDVSIDLDRSLEEVISCGADRLLTSGGEPSAISGLDQIARLREAAGSRIRIMAGAGIRQSNVGNFVQRTRVSEIHTSLNTKTKSVANHAGRHVKIGADADEFSHFMVREKDVRRFKATLDAIGLGTEPELSVQ
jgi:copper homeostasis protein